jgi:hypothetical protein
MKLPMPESGIFRIPGILIPLAAWISMGLRV